MNDSLDRARRFGRARRRRARGACFVLLLAACGGAAAQEGPRAAASPSGPCFRPRFEVETNPSLAGIYFSPDGRYVTQRGRKRMKVWDMSDGSVREYESNRNRTTSLAFSPDGQTLAAVLGRKAGLWDSQTGALKAALVGPGPENVTYG